MQPPSQPDPAQTAIVQSLLNKDTAIQQQQMNMIDQATPDYNLSYDQTGTRTYTDAFGRTKETPVYTATQTLTPQSQAIYDASKQAQGNMAGIARDQSAAVAGALSDPFKLGNDETEARLYELGSKRLDPQWAASEEAMRAKLANMGIAAGSDAFNREMSNFYQGKNDAYNSLMLSGRQLADQELLSERNQPLNELNALLSGSQVSQPNFISTPQTQVAGVDYAGLVSQQAAQQSAQNSSMMGGLFGAGGDIGAAAVQYGLPLLMASDRRLKEDIRRVGVLDNGLTVYAYRYNGERVTHIGLMADEVEAIHPKAVALMPNGFKGVNYAKAVEAI